MPIDIEAIRARNEARREGRAPACATACPEDVDTLLEALIEARRELHRLGEDNEDLRASAVMWADLYAACAERSSTEVLQSPRRAPLPSKEYEAALDAIAVLTEAIEALVQDCARCAVQRGRVSDVITDQLCETCARAVTALREARGRL